MVEFIAEHKVGVLIAFVLTVAVLMIGIQYADRQQKFDDETIKEQVEDLDSFAREESLIIDQYTQDRVSENYFIDQTEHINEKVLNFYNDFGASEIPEDQQARVQQLEKIVFELAMRLKMITSQSQDTGALHQQQQTLKELQNQLKNVTGGSQ